MSTPPLPRYLIRIEARHFTAGAITDGRRHPGDPSGGQRIAAAAPILAWSIGKPARDLTRWAERKRHRWTFWEIDDSPDATSCP